MTVRNRNRLVAAVALAVSQIGFVGAASAQIEFDWGGEEEWGGKRETVRFNSSYKPGEIVVSFSDRRIYYVTRPGTAISYPIAVPREQSRWSGVTSVSQKRINPSWTPTPEMVRENPRLPRWVPGGHPMNPLGVRALYLGASTYRIHGTDAPWTIGQAVSKGCIRMYNDDVLDLYPRVPVGARVTVTWQKFNAGGSAMTASYGDPAAEESADAEQASLRSRATFGRQRRRQAERRQAEAYDEDYYGDERPAPRRRAEAYDDDGYDVDNGVVTSR